MIDYTGGGKAIGYFWGSSGVIEGRCCVRLEYWFIAGCTVELKVFV